MAPLLPDGASAPRPRLTSSHRPLSPAPCGGHGFLGELCFWVLRLSLDSTLTLSVGMV